MKTSNLYYDNDVIESQKAKKILLELEEFLEIKK